MKTILRWARRLLAIGLLAAAAFAAAVWWWLDQPLPLAQPSVEVSIEPGMAPREVAAAWVAAGVQVPSRWLFEWFRWSGEARRIRAGSYAVEAGATPRMLLAKMVQGDETLLTLRLLEGWTMRQVREALAAAPGLKPVAAQMSDADLMTELGEPGRSPEGRFFPDTYAYAKGVSDMAVLRRAHEAMRRHLDEAWSRRAPDTPLKSSDEALILASIVEKETGVAADRPRIAGVFVNRLRVGMPLQSDPTVIYGLGTRFDGNLRKADLQADTPYNSYLRGGLPPTPIAAPGLAALQAAVQPEPTKALYFVARGDGSSEFSETLSAHERAVDRYQRRPAKP